jgi:hypothetical protein
MIEVQPYSRAWLSKLFALSANISPPLPRHKHSCFAAASVTLEKKFDNFDSSNMAETSTGPSATRTQTARPFRIASQMRVSWALSPPVCYTMLNLKLNSQYHNQNFIIKLVNFHFIHSQQNKLESFIGARLIVKP